MADYDNDIVLGIDLNVDKVKTKSKEIQADIEEIFKLSSGNDELSIKFKSLLIQLDKIYSKSLDATGTLMRMEHTPITTEKYDNLIKELEKVEGKLESALKLKNQLNAQKLKLEETNKPTEEYSKLQAEFEKAKTNLDALVAKQEKFVENGGKVNGRRYKSLQWEINQATAAVEDLQKQSKELETSGKAFTNTAGLEKVTDLLSEVDDSYNQIVHTQQKLLDQKAELESNDVDFIPGDKTDAYLEQVDKLRKINNDAVLAKERLLALDEVDFNNVTNNTSTFEEELQNTLFLITHLGDSASRVFSAFSSTVGNAGKALVNGLITYVKELPKLLAKASVEAVKLMGHLAKLAGNSIVSGIKRLASAITGVGKSASSSNVGLDKAFKTFIKYAFGVRSFFFLFRKIRSAVIAGFGDLAQVSEPFNQAVSNILTALTMLRNSLASAFSPIIEVVSPILVHFINLLSEVVTKIGMLIAALTGQKTYMRALPVQQNYAESVAKTSKNSDKAAKSTKNLNKEAEKLKKTLAGFDDVEILKGPDDDNDSGLDGGLGNGLDDAISGTEPAFMQTALGEAFKDFADLLKRAWANADFTEVGRIVGEKLKEALEKIPWDKIKDVLRRIGKSIATFLNGFLEVPGLFDVIGKTIAEAINSAFEFVEAFVSNFHWESLGNAIRDLILGVLNNIDWPLIYQTLAELGSGIGTTLNTVISDPTLWTEIFNAGFNLISAVLQGIDSFLTSVDWDLTGFAIGSGLNNGINNFSWETVSQTLIDLINGVFDLWYNFVTTFDFEKFGYYIGTTLSNTINGINWQEGAASVAETMNALLEALNGFMEGTDFASIGQKIVEVIGTFLDTFDWGELGEFLSNCLQSLCDFLIGIYENINWEELPDKILTKMADFMKGFKWDETAQKVVELIGAALRAYIELSVMPYRLIWNLGKAIIEGIKDGMTIDVGDIENWLVKNVWDPLKKGFIGSYGIRNDSSDEAKPFGEAVSVGVKEGVNDKFPEIPEAIENQRKDIKEAFTNDGAVAEYKEAGNKVPESVAEGVEENWDQIQNTVDPMVQEVVDPFMSGEAQQSYNYAGEMVIAGVIDGMYSESGSLYNAAQNIAIEAYNSMVSALDIGSPSKLFRNAVGKMIPAGMALGILDNEGLVENAMDTLTGTVTNTGKKALEIPAVVKGGVIPYQATISSSTENALNDVVDMLQSNYTDNITPDDLQDILTTVISQYLNISFYLGDEQIARHANSGNLKLNRRYNKLSMGEA